MTKVRTVTLAEFVQEIFTEVTLVLGFPLGTIWGVLQCGV
jgi:hypothetical protein